MAKYRKKPLVIPDASQWWRNGDHPLDRPETLNLNTSAEEGEIVRYYRRADIRWDHICEKCGKRMEKHGWIDTLEGGHIVCPGDWIITGIQGEYYPCKPDIFAATYEVVEEFGPLQHKAIHKRLHESLDTLMADWTGHTKNLPSQTTLLAFMEWSLEQTKNPTE